MKMEPRYTYLLNVIFRPLSNYFDGGIYYYVLKRTEYICISNKLINLLAFSLLHVEVVMSGGNVYVSYGVCNASASRAMSAPLKSADCRPITAYVTLTRHVPIFSI